MAATKRDAGAAFEQFVSAYDDKYPRAADCLRKDREDLLAVYDFPAQHWQHIRTTDPIESTFATVRLRTKKTRNTFSRTAMLSLVFKLCQAAEKRWLKLRGYKLLTDVIKGIKFKDGIHEEARAA